MDDIIGTKIASDTTDSVLEQGDYTMQFDGIRNFGKNMSRDPTTQELLNVQGTDFNFTITEGPPQGEHGLNPVGTTWRRTIWRPQVNADGSDVAGKEKSNTYTRNAMGLMVRGLGAELTTDASGRQHIGIDACVGSYYSFALTKSNDNRGKPVNYINRMTRIANYAGPKADDVNF